MTVLFLGAKVEVKITLLSADRGGDGKLKAFASVTLPADGEWTITNIKVVEIKPGEYGVYWPSTPVMGRCTNIRGKADKARECGQLNPITSRYCGRCGKPLPEMEGSPNAYRFMRDVVYPKSPEIRKAVEEEILKEFLKEMEIRQSD